MICCSLTSSTIEHVPLDMERVRNVCDCVEVRLDYIENLIPDHIPQLFARKTLPYIVTCRAPSEGGRFKGSIEQQLTLLKESIVQGAEYADIELSAGSAAINELITHKGSAQIIVSSHHFESKPNLDELYDTLLATGADIIKIAFHASSLSDNLELFSLLKRAKKEGVKLIGICMGSYGEISRILGPAYGSYLTYGCLSFGSETAPGQIPCQYLKRVYRVNDLSENVKLYGLIGNPVSKSKGFIAHNLMFKEHNLDHVYLNFLVEDLTSFMKEFGPLLQGASITMPYKKDIMDHCQQIDDRAQNIGAINTLIRKKDGFFGTNTDYSGSITALKEATSLANKKVLLIGAGGAARAIAYALANQKTQLTITNRTFERAQELAKELGVAACEITNINFTDIDIIVNATSVGMHPHIKQTPIPTKNLRRKIVFDSIYNPLTTELLHQARRQGCKTVSGLRMFLHQAADQLELWTHKKIDRDELEEYLLQYVMNE